MMRNLLLSLKKIGVLLIVLTSLLVSENVTGTTYYTISSNDWTNRNTWSTTSGGNRVDKGIYPGAGDDVVIEGGYTVTQNINSASCKNFTITSGKFILSTSTSNNNTLTISGNYTQSGGTFDFNSASSGTLSTVYIAGNFTTTANSSITTSGGGAYNGKIVFNGNSLQTLTFSNSGAAIWTTFLVNSGSILRLGSNVTLTGDSSDSQYYADLIVNGTIDFGTYVLNDTPKSGTTASHFSLNNGASLITANPNGVSTSGATGSVQFLGSRTYASGANYTYNGTSAQVTGNGLTGANNLTISNAGGVTLSNAVGVSGVLNLMNGNLITTSTNLLSVTSTATSAISGGSSSSFINGPVKWSIGTGTYLFPVGKSTGNYLPFTLTTSAASSPIITVEAFKADAGAAATFDATLSSISHTEYWKTILNSGTFTGSVSIDRGSSISPFDVIAGSTSQTGSFTSLNGTPGTTGISNSTAVGTNRYFVLAEKKKPTVSFTTASQSSASENGTMTVTVQLSTASAQTVTIPFTLSGTATGGGTDYSIIASPITINAGSTTGSTTITIVDDALVEGNETVILTLGTPTNATLGATTVHTATITDNDSPSVPSATLAIDKTSIAENGGVATVTATLSNTSTQPVTIWLTYSGTAGNGSDYNYSSNSITIAAGNLSGTVTVTSVSDCAVEGNETVVVDIGSVTNGTENGSQQVTTTIVDDDVYPTITLSANNLSISENGGTAIVTATLSNTFCQSIDIYLNFTGSTAINTTDYNYSSNKITIPSGSLTGTITVSSVNDYLVEGNETVVVGVESTNVDGISKSVSPVTVTIVDDDSYSITVTPTNGLFTTEAGGSATFTVVLNAKTYNDVTIQLTSSDLTEGTVSPSSLTFTSGNFFSPQTVTITGVDDALADGNIAYTIITSAAVSDDNNFKGIDPSDVSVTNTDNEVVSNSIWYRADAGITGNVTSWSDQSGNNINATNTGNVSKVDNSINFNPSLSFSSVNRQFVISGTKSIQGIIVVNKTPDTDGDLAGLIGADGDKGIRLSNSVNELTPVVTPYLSWRGNNNTDDWANETNGGTCRINGVVDANMLHSSKWHIANITRYQALSGTYYIGGYYSGRSYTGSIAEVMAFDNDPSDGAIESYLALKYGITLGSPSSVVDYISPSGAIIWTGSSTYQNDIAGLGKESTYMLDQRVSSSVNTPSGTSARVVMATDNDFTSSNQSARTSLSNGQYLIWGHNNLDISSLTTDGDFDRVSRIWKIQNTGISSSVNFQIDLNGFPNPSELSLILDDDANLSNGVTSIVSLTNSSGTLYQANLNFPTGTSYFTIGKCNPPTVTVNSSTICAGAEGATLTASVTPSGTYSYVWTVPAGATDPGNVTHFIATVAGTYSVVITNSHGCTGNGSGTLTVNEKPTISGSSIVCVNGTIALTGSGTAATNNPWISDSPAVATVSSSGLVSGISAGISKITYTDNNGCSTNIVITVNDLPQGSLTANGPFCTSGSGQLTWTVTVGTGPYTIVYNDGTADRTVSNVTSGTPFPVYTSSVTNTTTYALVSVSDANNCTRNSGFTGGSATITIDPAIANNTISAAQSFCGSGNPALLTGSVPTGGTGTYVYQWQASSDNSTWADIVSANSQNYDPATITSTTYYRRGVSSGTCSMVYSESVLITINTLPTTYSVTGGGSYCSGGSGVSVGLSNSQTGINYQLYLGANTVGTVASGTGSAITFGSQTAAGTYTVKAINSTTSCVLDMTGSVSITIISLPTPTITPLNGTECAKDDVVYSTESGQTNYVWTIPGIKDEDYTITGNINSYTITIKWLTAGDKNVTVKYDNANGCTGVVASSIVTVHPLPEVGSFN